MTTQKMIAEAILSKRKMVFNYKGEGSRLVCPHALFVNHKSNIMFDAYQLSGYSEHPSKVPGWKQFNIDEVTSLTILDEPFVVAHDYNPLSDKYQNVIAKV